MTSKPSNYDQNIQHLKFLIDWLKTEKNGEKQLTQLRKNSRNNGNKQRLIQAMKENKRKIRNNSFHRSFFYNFVLSYTAYRLQLAAWLNCNCNCNTTMVEWFFAGADLCLDHIHTYTTKVQWFFAGSNHLIDYPHIHYTGAMVLATSDICLA